MNINTSELFVLAIPFMGTTLGAAMVFLLKDNIAPKLEKLLLGFASGVMIAASVWSLLIPSIDMQKARNGVAWLPALVGFLVGIAFLLLLDTVIPHLHLKSTEPEGISVKKGHISKTTMMLFAVTLHNIPEGMSVGVAYAGAALQGSGISTAAAFALAIGIAIQNFPEGAIISLPLCAEGMKPEKSVYLRDAFRYCGTDRGIYYNFDRRADLSDFAIFIIVCGRGDDICRDRRVDTGIAGGGT